MRLSFASIFILVITYASFGLCAQNVPNHKSLAAYVNSFTTIGSLMEEMVSLHLIGQDDKIEIENFLKERKIPFTHALAKIEISNQNINTENLTTHFDETGRFKTADGKYIRIQSSDSAAKVFINSYNALTAKSQNTYLLRVFFNEAQAQTEVSKTSELLSTAGYLAAYHAVKAIDTAQVFANQPIIKTVGVGIESVIVGLKNLKDKGHIICDKNTYVIHSGYKKLDWAQEFQAQIDLNKILVRSREPSKWNGIFDTYSEDLNGAYFASINLLSNSLTPEGVPHKAIEKKELEKIFGKEPPPCDDKNAAFVEKKFLDRVTMTWNRIQQGLAPKSSSSANESKKNGGVK